MEVLWINLWIEHKVYKGVNNKSVLIWSLHIYCNCNNCFQLQFISVAQSCLTVIPWTTACQASLSFNISLSLLRVKSIELVIASNHLSSPSPSLSLYQHQGLFQMSQLFTSGGQSIRGSASASVLPKNIQNWFPLRLTGFIFLQYNLQYEWNKKE